MVKLDRIYTRGGDAGETSLGDGRRVSKSSPRIFALGAIDECNAFLGLAAIYAKESPSLYAILESIQNGLFDLGADVCAPSGGLKIVEAHVVFLEEKIDHYNALLTPLTSFVLPGGTPASAYLHVARVVCRRAERDLVILSEAENDFNPCAIRYINRLSDFLFILARFMNEKGKSDILWVPGKNIFD